MKRAQTIVEYTIITAFVLVIILLIINSINTKGIEGSATFGVHQSGSRGLVVPAMTP